MDLNALDNGKVKINLCGEELEVNKTDKVAETLKELLEARSINSFTILLAQNCASSPSLQVFDLAYHPHFGRVRTIALPNCPQLPNLQKPQFSFDRSS